MTESVSLIAQEQIPLVLHLDQLIELCQQQKIDIDKFFEKEINLQNSLSSDDTKFNFSLSSSQIAYLIHQNQFDMKKLLFMEQNLKRQNKQFRLNSSQFAYLYANYRITHSHDSVGLSAAQLIGLYMLQQKSLFSLTYQQIEYLALLQSKELLLISSFIGCNHSLYY